MGEKFNRFKENLKVTIKNMGASAEKTLGSLEKADKEMQEKLKKISGSASDF